MGVDVLDAKVQEGGGKEKKWSSVKKKNYSFSIRMSLRKIGIKRDERHDSGGVAYTTGGLVVEG